MIKKRKFCRLCENNDLILALSLEPTPVAEKYVLKKDLNVEDPVYPLDLYLCNSCGHIQLLDIIDPEYIFDNYTYSSGKSKGLVKHFKEYAEFIINNYKLQPGSKILDIGSNDGTLLSFFKEYNFTVLGIDPATDIAAKATKSGIKTYPNFVSKDLCQKIVNEHGEMDVVTVNNTFAHADDLSEMLNCIKLLLNKNSGIFVFEVSYLLDVIQKMLIGTIFHEHLSYHSLKSLNLFLNRNGIEIFNVKRVSIQGGSLICFCQLSKGIKIIDRSVLDLIEEENKHKLDQIITFKNFAANLNEREKTIKNELNQITNNNYKIVGYGAARSGTTIISQFKIKNYIDFIVDDNPDKHYKYSPGSHILVLPTEEIVNNDIKYVIILAWIHTKNIILNNIDYLENGGKFILCFPNIKIIDINNYKVYE